MNEIVHQPVRLKIMAALNALRAGEAIDFPRLKSILEVTDGNLGAHIATLENADYVSVQKDFFGKKPRTRVSATKAGRRAFEKHVLDLRAILDGTGVGD